ncbi:MAG: thioesterase family protein [Planctomycetota bacterium]
MARIAEHEIRVRYVETDRMGVVYHANYLVYMEEGRTRLLEELGQPYHELEAKGWALVVRKAELRFRAPARYGDTVAVRTRVGRIRGASVEFHYEIVHPGRGERLAEGRTELACLDLRQGDRRPAPLPEEVRAVLEAGAG